MKTEDLKRWLYAIALFGTLTLLVAIGLIAMTKIAEGFDEFDMEYEYREPYMDYEYGHRDVQDEWFIEEQVDRLTGKDYWEEVDDNTEGWFKEDYKEYLRSQGVQEGQLLGW